MLQLFCIMRRYLNSLLLLCNALILPTGTRKRFYIHVYATTFFDIVAKTMVLATKLNHSIFILTMNNFGLVYIIFSLIFNKFPNICNLCFHLFKFHLCIRLMFVNFESMLEVFHKAGQSFVHFTKWMIFRTTLLSTAEIGKPCSPKCGVYGFKCSVEFKRILVTRYQKHFDQLAGWKYVRGKNNSKAVKLL